MNYFTGIHKFILIDYDWMGITEVHLNEPEILPNRLSDALFSYRATCRRQ